RRTRASDRQDPGHEVERAVLEGDREGAVRQLVGWGVREETPNMKQGIHPDYQIANVHCSCGNTFQTRSTVSEIRSDICSNCHPFYTGKQKLMDTGGRVERFQRRYAKTQAAQKG